MNFPQGLGILSGVFLIAGYIPYIYEVFRKTTIPNRASWFIWSLSTAIILFGVSNTGTHEAIWVPVADTAGCFIIFILSIFYGVGGWSKTDKISLSITLSSLVILALTGNALIALLMNLLIYISGYVSTIKKALIDPKSESVFAWSLFFIGVLLNFLTVIIGSDTGFAVWLYPIVLVLTVGTLYFILIKPILFRK
ncbi:MAG: hypothetical protein V4664_04010 [Patescibacteria group bacterium]